jgi:thymidylate kinase
MDNRVKNFKLLISFLEGNNIHYVVLGRKTTLYEVIDGDIDIAVLSKDFKKIASYIHDFSKENNLFFIQNLQHESTAKYLILADKDDHSIICPDICCHFVRQSRLLIKDNDLLSNTQKVILEDCTFNELIPEMEFTYYFLKKIDKSSLNDSEFEHLYQKFKSSQWDLLENNLKNYFTTDSISKIQSIFNSRNVNALREIIKNLKKELHKNTKLPTILRIKDILLKMNRVIKPTGLSIAIMGSDGSGKSTIINNLNNTLLQAFRQISYYHLKPITNKKTKSVNTNPQGQKPYGYIKSIFKLFYLAVQYNIGFIKVKLKLIKSTLVVFDRYFQDILVDKKRFRYGAPNCFAKMVNFIIPKPKLYFLLDAPSKIIHERKKELTLDELEKQRNQYLSLFNKSNDYFVVDAKNNPEQISKEIKITIFNHLENRLIKRSLK